MLYKKKVKKNKLVIANTLQYISEIGLQVDFVYVVEFSKFAVLKSILVGKIPQELRNCQVGILPPEYRMLEDFNWVLLSKVRRDILQEA